MTTIYLIRHAEAEGNLYRRVHGWYNSLITENGYRQIAALEERFRDIHIDGVWSSDLFRTRTTARAVYRSKNLPLHTCAGLRELKLGAWEDRTFGAVRRSDPRQMELFNRTDPAWEVEGAETFFQLGDRIYETVRRLARREGILADPVYTGKALAGFFQLLEEGYFDGEENILFLHTGGAGALFAVEMI